MHLPKGPLMPLPQTLRATVSPDMIDMVGRLFNGGPVDVVNELLQNARRAGATRIDIDILSEEGHERLRIRDDGRGISDPRAVLPLGQSDWTESIRVSEDPAGMGARSAGSRIISAGWSPRTGRC